MKKTYILYLIYGWLVFFASSLFANEDDPLDKKDSMRIIESGKGWSKVEFTDKSIFEGDVTKKKGEGLLPGQDQLYIIYDMEGARNAPLPEEEKEELIDEISKSVEGGITILHAGLMDAVKTGKMSGYERYADSSKGWCNSWHHRSKSFSGNLGDLSETIFEDDVNVGNYAIDVNLDVSGNVDSNMSAKIRYKFKTSKWWSLCIPYKYKIVNYELKGDMTVDDLFLNLEGSLEANLIDKSWQLVKINAGEVYFFIGPIPVRMGLRIPIDARLKADVELTGNVGIQSNGSGTISFDKICNADFECIDQTPFVNDWNSIIDSTQLVVGLDAQLKARAGLAVSLLPFLYSEWLLSAKVGVNAGVNGWLWGYTGNSCGDADDDGSNEWVNALTLDADFNLLGVGTYKILGSTNSIGFLNNRVFYETHIGFFDLLPDGSSALDPILHGAASQGALTGNYTAKMRSCVPYSDQVTYKMSWGDGSNQYFSHDPTIEHDISHTWAEEGNYVIKLKALSDAHGRSFNNAITQRTVSTYTPGEAFFSYDCSSLTCSFDASDSTGDIVDYSWSFGANGVNVVNTFDGPGIYSVTLTVSDASGETDSMTRVLNLHQLGIQVVQNTVSWESYNGDVSVVDIYRDDEIIAIDSTMSWHDTTAVEGINHIYKVCELGNANNCSISRGSLGIIIVTED